MSDEVKNPVEGSGAESSPAEKPENVSSPEVKVEQPTGAKDEFKLREQVDNLNSALREERESRRVNESKVKDLEDQLKETTGITSKLKGVFGPEESDPETTEYLTKDQVDSILQQRDEERQQKSIEEGRVKKVQDEITEMTKQWDGKDGKPKYDDQEVLKWQKENNKLYLFPEEAFISFKKNEIVDWEVRQRLAGKKTVENVEQPGVSGETHEPGEKLPKTEQELRAAVLEAMNTAEGLG